jgi:hypothetical protein
MILKLTNAATNYQAKPILINTDHIISMFEDEIDEKPVTIIYSITKEIWHVAEKVNIIYNQMKRSSV